MKSTNSYNLSKIICLTEESVETLFLIGKSELVQGVSAFVKRPVEAQKLPKVSFFTTSNLDKISQMKPDLILGFSDIQKDIAKDLIERGLDVWISNHRSISGILSYILKLSLLVDAKEEGMRLISQLEAKIMFAKSYAQTLKRRPRVYFEEWDDPLISAIEWVAQLIELCGGEVVFADKSKGVLAKERFVTHKEVIKSNPDIIFGCWCGKKVKIDKITIRDGYANINAVKNKMVFELEPEIFLQPGPAPLLDGIDILINYFKQWESDIS